MAAARLEEFRNYLANIQPLRELIAIQNKFSVEIFLVGGIIRDFLLDRLPTGECVEIDFAIEKDAERVARSFARKIQANFVLLDERNQTFRVIIKGDASYQFDFSQFRGEDIKEDVSLRDFTINALALDLKNLQEAGPLLLIDPCRGLSDVKDRIVRVLSERSFSDDPLRIIRAFTFFAELGFEIESVTLDLIKKYACLLPNVAGERLAEQLAKIMISPCAYDAVKKMDEAGVLHKIFPLIEEMRGVEQGPYHHLDVWRHSLEALRQLEEVLTQLCSQTLFGEKIKQYLGEKLGGDRGRIFVVRLGVLFHDLGKPRAKEITPEGKIRFIGHEKIGADLVSGLAGRLRLSSREKNTLIRLVQLHLRPGYLVDTQDISPRAKLRFFRAAEEDSIALILTALADKRATRGPLTAPESQEVFSRYLVKVMEDYFYEKELVKPTRLLDGNEVMQILNLSPGPIIGELLRALEEVQVEKRVKDKREAEEFVKALFNTLIDTDKHELPRTKVELPQIGHRWAQRGIRSYFYDLATDKNSSFWSMPVKFFLSLLSFAYFLFIKGVLFLYKKNYFHKHKLPLKIISVGNITWGGTGKTQLAEYIAAYLKQHGYRVAILTRGYGKPVTSNQLPVASYKEMGDEAYMLARNLRDVPVIVDVDRARGMEHAIKNYNVDTAILDDGFQQWRVRKDLEIVTIDVTSPFGNGWLLPRGILREPLSSLKRADIFFLVKTNLISEEKKNNIMSALNGVNPSAMIVEAIYEPRYLRDLITQEEIGLNLLKDKDICILSGIASPDSFKATVEKLQCNIKLSFDFLDHYCYKRIDLDKILALCSKNNIEILLTTEKDAVRIEPLVKGSIIDSKIFSLVVKLKILESEEKFHARLFSLYQR